MFLFVVSKKTAGMSDILCDFTRKLCLCLCRHPTSACRTMSSVSRARLLQLRSAQYTTSWLAGLSSMMRWSMPACWRGWRNDLQLLLVVCVERRISRCLRAISNKPGKPHRQQLILASLPCLLFHIRPVRIIRIILDCSYSIILYWIFILSSVLIHIWFCIMSGIWMLFSLLPPCEIEIVAS